MITEYHISSRTVSTSSSNIRCKEENRLFKQKTKKEKKKTSRRNRRVNRREVTEKDKGVDWDHVTEKHKFCQQD